MKTSFISTYNMASGLRNNLSRLQTDLNKASVEVASSHHADVGLSLGNQSARALALRLDYSSLDVYINSNGEVAARLQQTQAALQSISSSASAFLANLVSTTNSPSSATQLTTNARSTLGALIDVANATGGGQSLFGGINVGQLPLAEYSGAPKLALDTAFANAFGLPMPDPQADAAVASIDPAAMADFLDNEFAALFSDPAWTDSWSSASDTNLQSSIAPSEQIETSANANEPAMRKLAMAYSMVAELGAEKLSPATLDVIVAKSREVLGSAISDLTGMQGRLGLAEERISSATKRLTNEKDVVSNGITSLEGVDPVEAKVRFDTLSTQIEMSYAMTTRILSLSILKYA